MNRSRWLMRGLLLFVLAFANLSEIWSPDVLPNALLPWTLVREGNADYDEFVTHPDVTLLGPQSDRIDREAYFFRACGRSTATEPPKVPRSRGGPPAPGPKDHVCSVFPPGMGILALPFFLPFVLAGAQALDLALLVRVGHVAAAMIETLAALLLWATLRRFASERWALALVLLYFLGTSVRTVSSQALWQHAGVHLALCAALWLVLIERPLSRRRAFLAGLALGLGGVVRQTTTLFGPFVSGPRRQLLFAVAGTVVGVVPLLLFNLAVLGSAFEQGYGEKPFNGDVVAGLFGLLFSGSRGLFVYEPFVLFAYAALFVAARRARVELVAERLSSLAVAYIGLVLLYSAYAEWWGGRVFGPRFLDDAAPLLIAALAWGIGRGLLRSAVARAMFWLCAAWSLLLFNAAALVYDQNTWDLHPVNVNDYPGRLFSWADPQWLYVLGQLPSGGARVIVATLLTLLAVAFLARVEHLLPSRR